jgi:hypothetical protein
MQKNVGGYDRIARLVAGPLLLLVAVAGVVGAFPLGTIVVVVAVLVGLILTVTGVLQRCPLNTLFGVDTCPIDAR